MPGGRPTDYRPEYCPLVVEFGARGESLVQFAAHVGVDRSTVQEWRKVHPAFSVACSRALTAAQSWWEKKCQDSADNRNFNSRLAEFVMAARFRDDYAPQCARIELNHTGGVQVRSLGRDELLRLAGEAIIDAELVENPAQLPERAENPPEKGS